MKTAEDKGYGVDDWSGDWRELEKTFPDLADDRDPVTS